MFKIERKQERNASIELYRLIMIYGIVLLHCCSQGSIHVTIAYRFLMSFVTGFVFLSGYYGIKFSLRKLCLLLFTGAYCVVVSFLCLRFVNGEFDILSIVKYFVKGNWFLWAYIVLMFFAPILNYALPTKSPLDKDRLLMILPILLLVFGWNFLSNMPFCDAWLPKPIGFGTHTFLMMIGVYCAARIFRISTIVNFVNKYWVSVIAVVSGGLCCLGLSHYDSPISFIFVAAIFALFNSLRLIHFADVIVRFLAPSVFSIYLIHWSPLGIRVMQVLEDKLTLSIPFFSAVITAVLLFMMSILLDLPRRFLLVIFKTNRC